MLGNRISSRRSSASRRSRVTAPAFQGTPPASSIDRTKSDRSGLPGGGVVGGPAGGGGGGGGGRGGGGGGEPLGPGPGVPDADGLAEGATTADAVGEGDGDLV